MANSALTRPASRQTCVSNEELGGIDGENRLTGVAFDHPIPLVKQRTHGRWRLYPNWTSYIADPDLEAEWPENLAYFGNPGEEEDKNWAVMMHDTHFAVTADEAEDAWGPDYQKYYLEEAGGYQAE